MTINSESYSLEEIVADHILTRLSVKSLLRYKCVCKHWRDLIKSSNFIRKHYDNESTGARKMVAKFGVDYDTEPEPTRQFHLYLLPDNIYAGCVPRHQRIYYIDGVSDFRDIHGPIDGMFLIEKGHFMDNIRFAWWNPATKECRLIPSAEFELKETFCDCCRMLGIGFDKTNQDYKIIWFRTFFDEWTTNLHPKIFTALYSTKKDSWNKVICDKENVYSVLTFNFETELFGKMPGPPIPGDYWATLLLRGVSLAVMASNEMSTPMISHYDIWQRIRENNWIKAYKLNPPIPSHWPCGIWEYDKYNFELLETYTLVFYDQNAKQATNLGFDFFERLRSGWAWPLDYKESLFPIPLRTENPTEQDNDEYFFRTF
ncbi:hypothetical protein BC332_15747 [Capsicum chinense]|nr:hypothetical protein BC332_15747 [Capsicum chinense]